MVDIKTAIHELNTGKIEFDYKDDDCCTTEGEVVILLKRLAELETADFVEIPCRCEKCKYKIIHTCAITGIKTLFCDYGEKPIAVQPTHYCGYGERRTI